MSDSTTWLDTLSASDSQKEVTNNELFDALSPSSLFGRHASACSGLTWAYYGGRLWDGTNVSLIANGTVSLTNAATNYVEATTAGVVSANTSGFTAGRIRIAKVVTSGGAVTSYEDHRTFQIGLPPIDVAAYIAGIPTASQLGLRFTTARIVNFPADFSGSKATAAAAATASAVFNVDKAVAASPNSFTTIGTVTFTAGAVTASLATTSHAAQSLAAGDVLRIVCPSSADATLSDISITLTGTR